jgi:hypothetical protein
MSGSLTGFFRAEVYVIHEMHSTDDFFIRQPAWPKKSRLLCNLYTREMEVVEMMVRYEK